MRFFIVITLLITIVISANAKEDTESSKLSLRNRHAKAEIKFKTTKVKLKLEIIAKAIIDIKLYGKYLERLEQKLDYCIDMKKRRKTTIHDLTTEAIRTITEKAITEADTTTEYYIDTTPEDKQTEEPIPTNKEPTTTTEESDLTTQELIPTTKEPIPITEKTISTSENYIETKDIPTEYDFETTEEPIKTTEDYFVTTKDSTEITSVEPVKTTEEYDETTADYISNTTPDYPDEKTSVRPIKTTEKTTIDDYYIIITPEDNEETEIYPIITVTPPEPDTTIVDYPEDITDNYYPPTEIPLIETDITTMDPWIDTTRIPQTDIPWWNPTKVRTEPTQSSLLTKITRTTTRSRRPTKSSTTTPRKTKRPTTPGRRTRAPRYPTWTIKRFTMKPAHLKKMRQFVKP